MAGAGGYAKMEDGAPMAGSEASPLASSSLPQFSKPPTTRWVILALVAFVGLVAFMVAPRALAKAPLRNTSDVKFVALVNADQAVLQAWSAALGNSKQISGVLRSQLEAVSKTAKEVRNSMDAWVQRRIFKHEDDMMKYVQKLARASALLSQTESDFRGLCETMAKSFQWIADTLKEKLETAERDQQRATIQSQHDILMLTIGKALQRLKPMMIDIRSVQSDFMDLADSSHEIEITIKGQVDALREQAKDGNEAVWAAVAVACTAGTGAAALATAGGAVPLMIGVCSSAVTGGVAGSVSIQIALSDDVDMMNRQRLHFIKLENTCDGLAKTAEEDYDDMTKVRANLDSEGIFIELDSIKEWKDTVLPMTVDLAALLKSKEIQ